MKLVRLNLIKIQKYNVHYLRSQLLLPNFNKNLTGKNKESPKKDRSDNETKSISCQILENNGFISDSTHSGHITYLPLGKRVLNKLTAIIRDEMNKISGQEIEMPSICDINLWNKTGRNELMGNELFRLNDRNQKKFCLCPTHEELVTTLVSKYSKLISNTCLGDNQSLRLYQITRKYRDESRPKHGLLRTREFLMKDMYSFHLSDSCVEKTYDEVCKSYEAIFNRLDLNYKKVNASVGAMGGKKSHEYHIESEVGEDKVYSCLKCSKSISADLINEKITNNEPFRQEDLCRLTDCCNELNNNQVLDHKRCIEIGHTFILGDRYTKCFPIDLVRNGKENSKNNNIVMGCYGIGVSRLLQASVDCHQLENHYPNWPLEIAPFQIAIIPARKGSKEEEKSQRLVKYLCEMFESNHLFKDDVYVDDRDWLTIGNRLVDTKLIGVPYIIVLGKCIHDEQLEIIINSTILQKALNKQTLNCHTRETAHVIKQLNNDYLYARKQSKLADYFRSQMN
jgi:prolyl-tRNA synthetase